MARAGLTQQSVIEAGIAADLAAKPDLLPSAIAELSDQAAIFASNNTNAFMFTGSADADSENTNFGEALATKAVEKLIELEERRRKDDDPAGDAGMIAELAARQREDLAEMTRVTYSDGQFHMFGMEIDVEDMDASVADTLENIDEVAARHNLDAQQTAQLTSLLIAYQNAGSPEEKAEILSDIAETQPEVAQEMAEQAPVIGERRRQNELASEEVVDSNIEAIGNEVERIAIRVEANDQADTIEVNIAARIGLSVAGETDLANSFEAGFSSAPDFNESADGQTQVAEATPPQSAPEVNGPSLTA
ncbi:MAG: hypothetical protein QNJ15_04090 [Erythrobacter sp.]|nr:hypothetical protein [Erythrobacter sp.]